MVAEKSADAFRTISEVADDLQVPQHVLRFWEGRFPQIKPLKRAGGRRYYRPEDIELLTQIRDLLYKQGLTIKGVQAALKDGLDHIELEVVPSTETEDDAEPVLDNHPELAVEVTAVQEPVFPPEQLPLLQPSLPGLMPAVTTQAASMSTDTREQLAEILDELEQLRFLLRVQK